MLAKPVQLKPSQDQSSVFRDSICAPLIKSISDDLSTLIKTNVQLSDVIGTNESVKEIFKKLKGQLFVTQLKAGGALTGKILLINTPSDTQIYSGLIAGQTADTIKGVISKQPDATAIKSMHKIIDSICSAFTKSVASSTGLDIVVSKKSDGQLTQLNNDIADKLLEDSVLGTVTIQISSKIADFDDSFLLIVMPVQLAIDLVKNLCDDSKQDLSKFLGVDLSKSEQKKTILVADDVSTLRNILIHILRTAGYNTLEAQNGKDALQIATTRDVDVIVSDIMMPEMDGITLCSKLKEDQNKKNIPVVMLSCLGQEQDIAKAVKAGAKAYIVKPFDKQTVLSTIEKLLN